MKNAVLSAIFEQMADIMEILGQDRFRINTYRKVGRLISDLPAEAEELLTNGQLAKTTGIGKSSIAKIREFVKTGTITAHQELLTKIPPTLPELLDVPGMGPKGVKAVYDQLHVTGVAELKKVIQDGSFATLPGFGDRSEARRIIEPRADLIAHRRLLLDAHAILIRHEPEAVHFIAPGCDQ